MRHEFTAVYERDADWVIAYCPEVPGANGQGHTKQEARESLSQAIVLVLGDRRDDGLRGVDSGPRAFRRSRPKGTWLVSAWPRRL